MKRFFFSLIALTAAAVGCTQSALLETPDQFGTEITFSPYTGRTPETKAQSIVGAGGDENVYGLSEAGGFNVLGFMTKDNTESLYMDKYVDLNTSGVWDYPGIVYWPSWLLRHTAVMCMELMVRWTESTRLKETTSLHGLRPIAFSLMKFLLRSTSR